MNYYIFVIAALVIVIVLTIRSAYNSKPSIMKRVIKKTPRKSIQAVNSGETVQIHGTIEIVGEPLIAPLSGRECGHYQVIVEREIPHGRKSRYVETIFQEEITGKYLIKDGNHYAYVDPKQLFSRIQSDRNFSTEFPDNLNERLLEFHEKMAVNDWHSYRCSIDYYEGVLEQDEKVIVSGIAEWKSAASLGLPAEYGRVLHIQAAQDAFSVITDDLKWLKHSENNAVE